MSANPGLYSPAVLAEEAAKDVAAQVQTPSLPWDFSGAIPGAETYGSLITTKTTWVGFTTPGAVGVKLLLENQADTGEFATMRLRARANNTTGSGDGGNSIGTTTGLDVSASAIASEYGNLKAINAIVQPNALNQTTDASNIVVAGYFRIDRTGTSVGRSWVAWLDTHAQTKASGGDYMERISHNGTVANDGVWTIYSGGRLPVLFNFEDVSGFLSTAAGASLTPTHKLAVSIGGATRYILVGTV